MGRIRLKWKCFFVSYLVLVNVFSNSLPLYEVKLSSLANTDTVFKNPEVPAIAEHKPPISSDDHFGLENDTDIYPLEPESLVEVTTLLDNDFTASENDTNIEILRNSTRSSLLRQVRPGQEVRQYGVELTNEGNSFRGRVVIVVALTQDSREDPIAFHVEGLNILSVRAGVFSEASAVAVPFDLDEGILEISPEVVASTYTLVIEYTAQYAIGGKGFHRGEFNGGTYLSMNLHPTNARRVFPCMDEPTAVSVIQFSYNGMEFNHLTSNSLLEENSGSQFRSLQGPPHVWGMVAHNFVNINIPIAQVLLYGRSGVSNQDAQASVAINSYFTKLNEWTNKPYLEIILNQDGRMNIIALPDVSTDWVALSNVVIWEPHIFMESVHSIKQRKTALYEIAHAMAKQWFGYVIFPKNWRYEWVVSGLASYAAYEMMREFQSNTLEDVTLLDVNTIFVTDVIQEALLRDAYDGAQTLEPTEDLFDEDAIRDHISGLLKYKAPALMRMMRIILGNPDQDFIRSAARALLNGWALQTVSSLDFVDALNSDWMANGNKNVDDIGEYLESWTTNTGYPLLHVGLRQGGVLITQERFSFVTQTHESFLIPITYTTSVNPDFTNYYPIMMTDATSTLNFVLDEEERDWCLFNIQGQGYYRVNYDAELWERLIEALEDPDRRKVIHPLNRATLVDDALNLARAGKLDYETAFRVVLTMELETEYAVWKAFVRNMNFLRKRLVALVAEDEDLDPDIYLRMVRRTIGTLENELSFTPDTTLVEPTMTTLTRGLVMDHACRANYQPCIAAAVDWFWNPDNNEVVNPNIPHDLRPAVYCTMVREGDDRIIAALYARLEIEPTLYERVVILESLACSRDNNFIRTLLEETIAANSPYSVEERSKIFAAVAESSFENALLAVNFISMRTAEMRQMYGGTDKFEQIIFILADNMADIGLATEFRIWVNAQNNNLDDSQLTAERALKQVLQNLAWDETHMNFVYEWIDENNASTMVLSIVALCLSIMVTLWNH